MRCLNTRQGPAVLGARRLWLLAVSARVQSWELGKVCEKVQRWQVASSAGVKVLALLFCPPARSANGVWFPFQNPARSERKVEHHRLVCVPSQTWYNDRMDGTKRTRKPAPTRWLGIGVRFLATILLLLLLLALNRCSFAGPAAGRPAVFAPATEVASARLRVDTRPGGANIVADRLHPEGTPLFPTRPAFSESGSE